jgi:hypothetical protein
MVGIYPSLLPTTLGTYLSRIIFEPLMMAFYSAETCRRILSSSALNVNAFVGFLFIMPKCVWYKHVAFSRRVEAKERAKPYIHWRSLTITSQILKFADNLSSASCRADLLTFAFDRSSFLVKY